MRRRHAIGAVLAGLTGVIFPWRSWWPAPAAAPLTTRSPLYGIGPVQLVSRQYDFAKECVREEFRQRRFIRGPALLAGGFYVPESFQSSILAELNEAPVLTRRVVAKL